MAQTLDEQINTVERALGECMIEHALVVVRAWLNEIGEDNPFEEAFRGIEVQYKRIFQLWLTSDSEENEIALNKLTGDTYQLVDAVYVELRLKRGLSPRMHGFNPSRRSRSSNISATAFNCNNRISIGCARRCAMSQG